MRKIIHTLILRYLERSGGVFHTQPYGARGRYVLLMTEDEYHEQQQKRARVYVGPRVVQPAALPAEESVFEWERNYNFGRN